MPGDERKEIQPGLFFNRINRDSEILQRTGTSAIWNDKTDHFLRRSQVIDNLVVLLVNEAEKIFRRPPRQSRTKGFVAGEFLYCDQGHATRWHFGNLTNAAMEGFNNKVRTMLRQAYGYRDLEYMRLKIFNLPENNIKIII